MSEMDQLVYVPRTLKGQRFAVTVTGSNTALAAAIAKSGWIRVIAEGCNVDVVFGVASTTQVVFGAVGSDGTVGYPIKNGSYHDFWLTGAETHIIWDADATGAIWIGRAGKERVGGPVA